MSILVAFFRIYMATVEVGWHSQIIQTLSTRQHHSVDKARYLDRLSTDSRDFVDKFILSVTFFVLQPGSFLCHIDRDFSMSYRPSGASGDIHIL